MQDVGFWNVDFAVASQIPAEQISKIKTLNCYSKLIKRKELFENHIKIWCHFPRLVGLTENFENVITAD